MQSPTQCYIDMDELNIDQNVLYAAYRVMKQIVNNIMVVKYLNYKFGIWDVYQKEERTTNKYPSCYSTQNQ